MFPCDRGSQFARRSQAWLDKCQAIRYLRRMLTEYTATELPECADSCDGICDVHDERDNLRCRHVADAKAGDVVTCVGCGAGWCRRCAETHRDECEQCSELCRPCCLRYLPEVRSAWEIERGEATLCGACNKEDV